MKLKAYIIVTAILLITIVFFYYNPKITPNNININYELKKNTNNQEYIQLKLDINSDKNIIFSEKNFYHVYVFFPDYIKNSIIDFTNFNDEEYHLGMDSRTYNIAIDALKEQNINIYDSELNTIEGFYVNGDYPIEFNYYYYPDVDVKNNDKGYIVFSYYENKFLNDLSWSKIYPVVFK